MKTESDGHYSLQEGYPLTRSKGYFNLDTRSSHELINDALAIFFETPICPKLVFDGPKKVELRRRVLTRMRGRDIFIYVTSPVGKLRGGFRVGEVWTGTPEEIWNVVSKECVHRQARL